MSAVQTVANFRQIGPLFTSNLQQFALALTLFRFDPLFFKQALIGLFLQQPLLTTVIFLLLLPNVIFNQRWDLIGIVGKMLFAKRIPTAEYEDRRLMRLNNTIASVLLGSAQLVFVLGFPIVGWTLSLMVAAAGVALAGFCIGCFFYFQFKMLRYLNNIHIQ